MRIIFPNPFGYSLPDDERINALRRDYGFSHESQRFLSLQNGFDVGRFLAEPGRAKFLIAEADRADRPTFTLSGLYGLDAGGDNDLEAKIRGQAFIDCFFPIGAEASGGELVEVLRGPRRGQIVLLDFGVLGATTQAQRERANALPGYFEADSERRCEMLLSEGLGLAASVAPSMSEFSNARIRFDGKGVYVASDAAAAVVKPFPRPKGRPASDLNHDLAAG